MKIMGMSLKKGKPGSLLLRGVRCVEKGYEDQPNTPSKNKVSPRRPLLTYIGIGMFMIVGLVIVPSGMTGMEPFAGHVQLKDTSNISHENSKTNRDKPGTNPHRPRSIGNSQARQREALEIADTLHIDARNRKQDSLGQLSGGGGSVQVRGDVINPKDFENVIPPGEASLGGGPSHTGEVRADDEVQTKHSPVLARPQLASKVLPADIHDAVKEDPSAAAAAVAAVVDRPPTVLVMQPLMGGGTKEIAVDRSRFAFLEKLSEGLESQELEGLDGISPSKSWWASNGKNKLKALMMHPPKAGTFLSPGNSQRSPKSNDLTEKCKIHVLDINNDVGPRVGAKHCNLAFKRVWPFARHNWGIDGVSTLPPEHYQYSTEYWISNAIKNSTFYEPNPDEADVIFVDMWCYHTAWLAYIHPLGNRNTTNPEPYMRKTLNYIVKSKRFENSKGGDFVFVHPSPIMRGLFKEEAMCEDLASAFHLVPERASLCVWTQDSASQGQSLIMPYVATLDLDHDSDLLNIDRDILIYFRGGCGHPNPTVRGLFAAGKMLRYELVDAIETHRNAPDIDVKCSCDICDNHTPHAKVMESYRRARFCPVLASNAQSSRRLSEVILSGCIPVFIGPPFHSLPLSLDVDYGSMGIFINITNSSWIDHSSPHYLKNRLVTHLWPLEDADLLDQLVQIDTLPQVVDYLRHFPEEEEKKKRTSVVEQRYKFFYGPVPESVGGDGRTSDLGTIAMKHMCRHAAEAREQRQRSERQGITKDEHVKVVRGTLMHDETKRSSSFLWSFLSRAR